MVLIKSIFASEMCNVGQHKHGDCLLYLGQTFRI